MMLMRSTSTSFSDAAREEYLSSKNLVQPAAQGGAGEEQKAKTEQGSTQL
jgi:hypothetical protein